MSGKPVQVAIRQNAFETSWGVALWVVALAAVLFILDFAAAILLPTAYAIVLALVLSPIARTLSRLRIPDGISAVLTVAMAAAGIITVISIVTPAVAEWMQDAPRMARQIDQKLKPLKEQLQVVEQISNRIQGTTATPGAAVAAAGEGMVGSFLSTGANIASQTVYVLFLTLFLLALRTDLRRRFIISGGDFNGRVRMARAVRDVGKNVTAYLFILTCINAGVAVVTTAAFYAFGMEDPLVWGLIYGLACYIPVIGPTSVILASAVVGIATEPTLVQGLLGPAILLFINAIESQLIAPWVMARRIELNPVALFVSLAFVVWLWGIPAAIIAAPLLIVIYTFSKHTPALQPIAALLAPVTKPRHEPPPPPPITIRRKRANGTAKERKPARGVQKASAA
ncbi:MAG: AI-2E family transporter [Micropepsaceae bacterium]